jgi:hypothetical protein
MRRKNASLAEILFCHATRCQWEYQATYLDRDHRGQVIWRRRLRCRRCGSYRLDRVPPNRPKETLGRGYDRCDGWYDVPEYYGDAWDRLIREGFIELESAAA